MMHQPYSPDASPCDYGLFAPLKRPLKEHRFATDNDLQKAVKKSAKEIPITAYQNRIEALPARYQKIIDFGGDYFV